MQLRASGKKIFDLTVSNPTRAQLDYPLEQLAQLWAKASQARYQPASIGLESTRQCIAEYYAARGAPIRPDQIVITASTSEAYSYLFTLLCNPEDTVYAPSPSYPLLSYLADISPVNLAHYRLLQHDDWRPDYTSFGPLTPTSKAIISISPNNPTGSFLNVDDLHALSEFAHRHNISLIQDEVFADYPLGGTTQIPTLASQNMALSFTLNGLSKIALLPHYKLGWVVVTGPDDLVRESIERLTILGDTFLSTTTAVQTMLPELLPLMQSTQSQLKHRLQRNLNHLRNAVSTNCPATVLPVQAGWYATLQVPAIMDDESWALRLLEEGVSVQPAHFFDFPNSFCALVISLMTPEDEFDHGVSVIAKLVSNLTN